MLVVGVHVAVAIDPGDDVHRHRIKALVQVTHDVNMVTVVLDLGQSLGIVIPDIHGLTRIDGDNGVEHRPTSDLWQDQCYQSEFFDNRSRQRRLLSAKCLATFFWQYKIRVRMRSSSTPAWSEYFAPLVQDAVVQQK